MIHSSREGWGSAGEARSRDARLPTAEQGGIQFGERYRHEAGTEIEGEFDLVFMDGDHSLRGITQDWSDWAGRIVAGGIATLHDTRVPAHNPSVRNLCSYHYFESCIRHDIRFELLEQVDSLSVLRRR